MLGYHFLVWRNACNIQILISGRRSLSLSLSISLSGDPSSSLGNKLYGVMCPVLENQNDRHAQYLQYVSSIFNNESSISPYMLMLTLTRTPHFSSCSQLFIFHNFLTITKPYLFLVFITNPRYIMIHDHNDLKEKQLVLYY